jgi:hypothetical protein
MMGTGLHTKRAKAARGGKALPKAQLRAMGHNFKQNKNRPNAAPPKPRMCFNPLHLIDKLRRSKISTRMANCVHCFLSVRNAEGGLPNSAIAFSFCSNMCTIRPAYGQKQVQLTVLQEARLSLTISQARARRESASSDVDNAHKTPKISVDSAHKTGTALVGSWGPPGSFLCSCPFSS